MRACIAILKDSFRESAASRILWFALVAIVIVLIALAPLGFSTSQSTQLRPFELVDTERLLKSIYDDRKVAESPSAHLWSLLNEEQQTQIEEWLKPETPPNAGENRPGQQRGSIQSRVLRTINDLLKKPEFYRPESWASVKLPDELQAADDASITDDSRAARNLKRLGAAYRQSLDVQDELSLALSYGTMVLFGPLQGSPEQATQLIDETIIVVLSVFLGFFGVFSSLLVTASIIPRTFEPGEISLLLSKPIRRSVLFVTKFLGGCVFTLLCAAVLVTGIWFLLWVRFDLWRPELLWCIPLYVFQFAIYFSVSALAGAIWRNSTISLVIVVLFWIVVTTTGAIHGFVTNGYFQTQEIVEVAAGGSEVFIVDGSRKIRRWDSEQADWARIADDGAGNSLMQLLQQLRFKGIRPRIVATEKGEKIISLQAETSRFGDAAPATLFSGAQDNGFIREVESVTPEPVFAVYVDKEGQLILPGLRSVYRYVGVSDQVRKTQAFLKRIPFGLFSSAPSQAFEILSPKDLPHMRANAGVAFNRSDDSLTWWNNGTVFVLNRGVDGRYTMGPSRTFEKKQAALISTGGDFVLCALSDGTVLALDKANLETVAEAQLKEGEKPRVTEFSADGRWGAVLSHEGHMLSFSGTDRKFDAWLPRENGAASAIRFDSAGKLMVADGRRTITIYDADSRSPETAYRGLTTWPYYVFDYVVWPMYTALPKPSEINNMVRYLVTGEKSAAISEQGPRGANQAEDLTQQRVTFDIWGSFWSNLGFICVMLAAGCVYLIRHDF